MSDEKPQAGKQHQVRDRLRKIEEDVHQRVSAAEVAAEEAAGFGAGTAFVEAVEAAANPQRVSGQQRQEGVPSADAQEVPEPRDRRDPRA